VALVRRDAAAQVQERVATRYRAATGLAGRTFVAVSTGGVRKL
jgi:galactokinase